MQVVARALIRGDRDLRKVINRSQNSAMFAFPKRGMNEALEHMQALIQAILQSLRPQSAIYLEGRYRSYTIGNARLI